MRLTVVFEQNGRTVAAYPVEATEEGELELGISRTIARFRRESGISLFDGVNIRLQRDD